MGDKLQFGIEFGHVVFEELILKDRLTRSRVDGGIGSHEVGGANHSDAFHGDAVVKHDVAAKTALPVHRQAVPPVAECFFLVDFGGIDTRNLDAVVLAVEVDFDKAVPNVVDRFISDGFGGQVACHRGLEKDGAIVSRAVGDALQVELEISPFEEKVDVFEIGLHILINRGLAVHV